MGAIQAQDYEAALWAVGLRSGASEAAVRRAVAGGEIIRSWPHRGTLHFVAAGDARWMIELLGPRSIAGRRHRLEQLGLDAPTLRRAERAAVKTMAGGRHLTREAFFQRLEEAGVSTAGQRGYHLAWRLAQQGVLCFGAPAGKQQTFALLDEWAPSARSLPREEALAELARRYFASHGPATVQDLAWWAGLTVADAARGAAAAAGALGLVREAIGGRMHWSAEHPADRGARGAGSTAHLLPSFDEYLLGYRDRSPVLAPQDAVQVVPGANGMFLPIVVTGGHVTGTWKRSLAAGSVTVTWRPFAGGDRFPAARERALRAAAGRYARFLGRELDAAPRMPAALAR